MNTLYLKEEDFLAVANFWSPRKSSLKVAAACSLKRERGTKEEIHFDSNLRVQDSCLELPVHIMTEAVSTF